MPICLAGSHGFYPREYGRILPVPYTIENADLTRKMAGKDWEVPAILLGDFCQTVPKRVDDEFKPVGNVEF